MTARNSEAGETEKLEKGEEPIRLSTRAADLMLERLGNAKPLTPQLREAALKHKRLAREFGLRRNQTHQ